MDARRLLFSQLGKRGHVRNGAHLADRRRLPRGDRWELARLHCGHDHEKHAGSTT